MWHSTLSTFLRDYVYMPLGGFLCSPRRQRFNLFLTMFAGGLWHGAGWTFVLYGICHGLYVVIHQLWRVRVSGPLGLVNRNAYKLVAQLVTFLVVVLTLLLFRSDSVTTAGHHKAALELLLDQIFLTLKPGGRYLIMGPNLRDLPEQYWDFYDDHLGLTHASLCEIPAIKGFDIEQCVDRFLPYTTQGAMPTHPLPVRAYLAVPLMWRLPGKQFFIAARKPV